MKRRTNVNPCAPVDKWRRGDFCYWHGFTGTAKPVTGYLRGAFGVFKYKWLGTWWSLTHLPSGCSLGQRYTTLRDAKAFADRLQPLVGPRGGLSKRWREIDAEMRRARQ